ncbi:MAG: anti-sigma factor domain-containing protein [Roseiflexaceae bacterium]
MNDHPYDSLSAFALGALDTDEARQVIAHVAACPSCRDDVELWGAVIALLPYMAMPSDPPAHIKRRLFALVDAAAAAPHGAGGRARPRVGGVRRWVHGVAASAFMLALVFGVLLIDMRWRADALTAQVAERDQQMLFVSAAIPHRLAGPQPAAVAIMFVKPGEQHVVLVVQGLKPLAAGKTYEFWFATATQPRPSQIFMVGPDGTAMLEFDAPAPVDRYAQVMVTVEPAGGSQIPSGEVVLQAML